ncbi:MAG: flagellin lysine-N-methylase [Oscillospiraceae bacterium]|nr:flagellin lysine-N-methylase [Oscillospiraceae bacterium]
MSRRFFVPDYYPGFACKCGSCRSSCCRGWPVIIAGEEYTRLQEADCSPEFRKRLNEAFNLDGDPRRGGTAHVVHDRSGGCPLLGADGLCTLQLELGEGLLPDVCRLYPRNTREVCGEAECACAGSCEAVTELLLRREEPLGFCAVELEEEPRFPIEMKESYFRECRLALEVFRRGEGLTDRFRRLNEALFHVPEGEDTALNGVGMLWDMTAYFAKNSPIVGECCRKALARYGLEGRKPEESLLPALAEGYGRVRRIGRTILPNWEMDLTNLILNSMFYNSFPHVGGTNGEEDPFLSLCVTAAFADFVLMGCLREESSREDAADVISSLFRLIEHSDFKYRAVKYYREWGDRAPGTWLGILRRITE